MRKIALSVAFALFAGCGSDRSEGGGGIETNNTVGMRVLDSLDHPVPGATVDLLPADWIDSGTGPTALRTGRTDGQGFLVMSVPRGRWTLEAKATGTSGLRTFQLDSDLELGSIPLARTAVLTGNVYQAFPGQRVRICVQGTTHSVLCDSAGAYSMEGLPSALLLVKTVSGSIGTDSVTLAPGSTASLPWTGSPVLRALDAGGSIIIEDFSGSRPSIASADTTAGWYMASDGSSGGTAIRRSDSTSDSVFDRFFVPNTPAGQAGSFQGFFDIDTTNPSPGHYAQIGLSFHDTSRCIDLSGLDSVTFLASGTDSVRTEFLGRLNYSTPAMYTTPGQWVRLDSGWKTVSLRAADLATPSGSAHPEITWSTLSACVNEFRFYTTRPAHLRLSNLRFWGPPLSNFLHPAR